jgi:EAL domain-containing protein (putative c-di-GMP-specific phosphodiesterase class I)
MAVNLSARQLASPELLADVRQALQESGLDASRLVLEMTETSLVQDALSYLRQFPVDILKIDRSFINTITDRGKIPAIVRGLLDLGRTLQLETVAEGIESDTQLGQLRDQQCELGQGYLFARPLPAAEAEKLLGVMTTA